MFIVHYEANNVNVLLNEQKRIQLDNKQEAMDRPQRMNDDVTDILGAVLDMCLDGKTVDDIRNFCVNVFKE